VPTVVAASYQMAMPSGMPISSSPSAVSIVIEPPRASPMRMSPRLDFATTFV
jgi:hypothetical protein